MKKSIYKLSVIFLLTASLIGVVPGLSFFKNASTVLAIGDLTVNWGVPEGDPIFVVSNMAPGDVEERTVQVSNGAVSSRPVAIKGIKTGGAGNLENVLNIEILEGAASLYSGNLNQFFQDTTNMEFIPLSTLAPGSSTAYTIKVTFDDSAGNQYQNTSVIFDLIIGIAFDVPNECSEIEFSSPTPIFGTSGNDRINGTRGNDLIIALEGNDKVFSFGGDDCIIGGEGNDELRGETGDDFIFGNEGNDLLIGAVGNDLIRGGEGDDKIRGENNEDQLFGEGGNDKITGGNSNDEISGGEGNDDISAENGADVVTGDGGNDKLDGGAGNDHLTGGLGNDSLNGKAGTDTCSGEIKISCEILI